MQPIDYFFGGADQIFYEEWLGSEIFHTVDQGAKTFFNVRAAGHEEERDLAGGFAAAEFFEQLAAVEAGHLVIAENNVWEFVNDLQERIAAVRGGYDFAIGLETLGDQIADQRIVLGKEQLNGFAGCCAHRRVPGFFAEGART